MTGSPKKDTARRRGIGLCFYFFLPNPEPPPLEPPPPKLPELWELPEL